MIPIKIEITNFLSYRARIELDFHGIHLACISGANGAGKSSILDAITWSLFGNCRSKRDDDVVNRVAAVLGEAAEIQFTFEVSGVIYRVIRRKRVNKPLILEFQIASSEGQWKSLSEAKIRETQAAIEALLNLNYDTFTNASFLLQGKADEFTTKTPNQRKEILADLLGVNEWNRLKELASIKRKVEENHLLLVDARLADIEEELTKRPERTMALDAATSQLAQVNARLELFEERLDGAKQSSVAIDQQRLTVSNLQESADRSRQNSDEVQLTLDKRRQEREAYQKLLENADIIQEQYLAWQHAETETQMWQKRADAYYALERQFRPYELKIERARASLEQRQKELEAFKNRLDDLSSEKKSLTKTITENSQAAEMVKSRLEIIGAQEKTLQETKEALQTIEAERALLKQEASQLKSMQQLVEGLQGEKAVTTKNLAAADIALESAERDLDHISVLNERLVLATADQALINSRQPDIMKSMRERKDLLDRMRTATEGRCPLCDQALTDQHREEVVVRLESEGQGMAAEYRQNKSKIEILTAEIPVLESKVKNRDHIEREQRVQQQRKATAEARLSEIERKIKEWELEDAGRLDTLETLLIDRSSEQELESEITSLQELVTVKPELEQELIDFQENITNAKARVDEINRAQSEWQGSTPDVGLKSELESVKAQLAAEDFVPEAQTRMADLKAEMTKIAYLADAHAEAKGLRDQLSEVVTKYQQLQQAKAATKPLDDSLKDLEKQLDSMNSSLLELSEQLEIAQAQLEVMLTNLPDVTELEKKVYELREDQIAVNRLVATNQQNISVLDELTIQKEKVLAESDDIRRQIRRLRLLEKACGREGVQALLIERALPEIEDDANELLYRLTGGKMQVLFETQRKLKTSDRLAETLDIRIADEVGERPYENYSGGEQFRVNFAIRLALSKILTRRAGARLQTLVIDEGFGSQDPEGQQRLIEAINTVKEEFELVLVITHIDAMRDAFPTYIEVVKDGNGSSVSVTEA